MNAKIRRSGWTCGFHLQDAAGGHAVGCGQCAGQLGQYQPKGCQLDRENDNGMKTRGNPVSSLGFRDG